ncbi:hypothetical protein B0H11DRAFT_2281431 [Mycena galericulata]|nr:hypothetical protein B0H11DRAFT_2281431 [Mycena galericulata]
MSSRYAAHTSSFPRSAPAPTRSPMPTMRAHVDDTVRIVRTLPKGYDFVPPHAPLTYPASYHLIPAGPQNAPRKKRAVFQTLTNFAGRVRLPKRKEPEADLADESFSCCVGLQVTVLRDAVGRKCFDRCPLVSRYAGGGAYPAFRAGLFFDIAIRMVASRVRWSARLECPVGLPTLLLLLWVVTTV